MLWEPSFASLVFIWLRFRKKKGIVLLGLDRKLNLIGCLLGRLVGFYGLVQPGFAFYM